MTLLMPTHRVNIVHHDGTRGPQNVTCTVKPPPDPSTTEKGRRSRTTVRFDIGFDIREEDIMTIIEVINNSLFPTVLTYTLYGVRGVASFLPCTQAWIEGYVQ